MEVLIHTFIQTKATWGKRTCPRFETASVGLNPGPLDLETCALPTRPPRPTRVQHIMGPCMPKYHTLNMVLVVIISVDVVR